jgi:hypothetical protein
MTQAAGTFGLGRALNSPATVKANWRIKKGDTE